MILCLVTYLVSSERTYYPTKIVSLVFVYGAPFLFLPLLATTFKLEVLLYND